MLSLLVAGCIGTDIVEDIAVDQLNISSRIISLAIGESFQFEADFFNEVGVMDDSPVSWESTDESIVSIDNSTGVATAVDFGEVFIIATANGTRDSVELIASNVTELGSPERVGQFSGVNNYSVEGDFTLAEIDNGLTLTFGDNFRSSNGPGLFVYLSNSPSRVNGGIELGNLQSNSGEQTYTISDPNVNLDTYNHVLVYCKPFGVAFGTGELSN